ncbi:MAG TPA: cyclodeaminase/cyclohydrolase family protein [Tepidisphaeraceae bacterium]|jgi:formiminotetrahydrofolate cyclodeaminase|nr:cyclodeaminase/cyclohydrolase family protein [Tepidisphaeraceae bacterium]
MFDAKTSLADFLAATAARQPAPGGGSVTALVGGLAAALGEMVVNYSVGRKGLEAHQAELKTALGELTRARKMLLDLMVEDQAAYEMLSAVRKLPADSPERVGKMPAALLACIRIPEAVAATGVAILQRCDSLVEQVNPHLLSDLAVCADLAMAAIRCAIYNVRVNIAALDDPADRLAVETTVGQILSHALLLIQRVAPRIWNRAGNG